jgi:hypothetical protein
MVPAPDTEPLSDFTANPSPFLDKLLATREPIRLNANGTREIIILEATSYDDLLRKLARAVAISAVLQSQQEFAAGHGLPFREVVEELLRKHQLPAPSPE